MSRSDYHVHTSFSSDCSAPMEEVIKNAISEGVQELALTDHVDFDFPGTPGTFLIDYDEYLGTFNRLKNLYCNKINLLLGVEIGCQPHIVNKIDHLIKKYPFDFVICSTHTVDRMNCAGNTFFENQEPMQAYIRYLENVLINIKKCSNYDVCGHLDFIVRYNPAPDKKFHYQDFSDLINTILRTIVETGHGLEVNTAGYRYGLDRAHPSLEVLQRYREMGGEIVTIGSDAHRPEHVGNHFESACELLKAAGFSYITRFKKRKPIFTSIEKYKIKLPISA